MHVLIVQFYVCNVQGSIKDIKPWKNPTLQYALWKREGRLNPLLGDRSICIAKHGSVFSLNENQNQNGQNSSVGGVIGGVNNAHVCKHIDYTLTICGFL